MVAEDNICRVFMEDTTWKIIESPYHIHIIIDSPVMTLYTRATGKQYHLFG